MAEDRRVVAANPVAQRLGVRADLGVASALALAPGLVLRERAPADESAALDEVAAWACQFTPHVSLDPPACVLLEIAGSLRLFGGAAALARRVRAQARDLGFTAEVAVAPTPRAAYWLARSARAAIVTEPDALGQAIADLPADLIGCGREITEMLLSVGAFTLEDCLHLPRAGLARRGAAALLDVLDQGLGRVPDPRPWFSPPERYASRIELAAPSTQADTLTFIGRRLLAGLAAHLRARHAGVERFALALEHEGGASTRLAVTLGALSREESRFSLLAREHLARLELAAPVAALAVLADEILPLASAAAPLFGAAEAQTEQLSLLIERLRARLGANAVYGLQQVQDHRPERAWTVVEPGTAAVAPAPAGARPLWLLAEPQPLGAGDPPSRRGEALRLEAGPERIESGWWDEGEARRDYFIARAEGETLLWIFRELGAPEAWYLHGIFA